MFEIDDYIDRLRAKIEDLKAEIKRKDAALQRVVDAFTPEVIHIGSMHNKYRALYRADIYDPIKQARDALSEVNE